MKQSRAKEKSAVADSLGEMQRTGGTVYRHAGVELARIPGAEKLRVRVTTEEGDADASDFTAAVDADTPAGEGVSAGD